MALNGLLDIDLAVKNDGDIITTTIAGIGTMINHCRRVSDYVKGA